MSAELHRLEVVELRLELATEFDVAGKRAADFDVDGLPGVVAHPLRIDLVLVPPSDGR